MFTEQTCMAYQMLSDNKCEPLVALQANVPLAEVTLLGRKNIKEMKDENR